MWIVICIAVIVLIIYFLGAEENESGDDASKNSQHVPNQNTLDVINEKIETFNIGLGKINDGLEKVNNSLDDSLVIQQATKDYRLAIAVEEKNINYLVDSIKSTKEYRQKRAEHHQTMLASKNKNLDIWKKYAHVLEDNESTNSKLDDDLSSFKANWNFCQPVFDHQILIDYDARMKALILEKVDELSNDRQSELLYIKRQLDRDSEVKGIFIKTLENKQANYLLVDMFS